MSDPSSRTPVAANLVLWGIWAWIMAAMPFYKFLLGGGKQVDSFDRPVDLFVVGMFVVPLAISVAIRWLLIPRLQSWRLILAPFIVGIALAESLVFYGKFLFPEFESVFFYAGLAGVGQFIPFFARK